MSAKKQVSRRRSLKLAAATSVLPLVHVRTVGAAGKVTVLLWDYWVIGQQARAVQILLQTDASGNAVQKHCR